MAAEISSVDNQSTIDQTSPEFSLKPPKVHDIPCGDANDHSSFPSSAKLHEKKSEKNFFFDSHLHYSIKLMC